MCTVCCAVCTVCKAEARERPVRQQQVIFASRCGSSSLCALCSGAPSLCALCTLSVCTSSSLLKLELSSAAEPFHCQYLSSCLDVTLSRKRPSWIQMFAIPSIKPSCKLESRQVRPLGMLAGQVRPLGSFSAGRCGFLLFALNQGSQQIDIDSLTT